eukprot:1237577-Pleurochrysis_carterae.AAC.1
MDMTRSIELDKRFSSLSGSDTTSRRLCVASRHARKSCSMCALQSEHLRNLRDMLLGDWLLSKELVYTRGGVTSTFEGLAVFEPIAAHSQQDLLHYIETGNLTIGNKQFRAQRRLIWDFSCTEVLVYFDESLDRSFDRMLASAKLFHVIRFDSLGVPLDFEHPCVGDMYRGKLLIDSWKAFRMSWKVTGPVKMGSILMHFKRRHHA